MKYFCLMKNFCDKLNIKFDGNIYEKFMIYMKELIEYNKKINLTSITNEDLIINRHFLDSISIFNYKIEENATICDIGSGAGFPGIPMKIIRDDLKIDLVESTNKKVEFLKYIVDILNIKNINIINKRVENVSHETFYREKYDYVVSRAMARLDKLLEMSFSLVKINGKYIALKGKKSDEELEKAYNTINKMGGVLDTKIYLKEFDSNLVIIDKIYKTPEIYPRKYNLILKKSL